MSEMDFPFVRVATATVNGTVGEVFAALDDHKRLAGHMEKRSLMMAGTRMEIETDNLRGQALGSEIRLHGRVLGISLSVTEKVVDCTPPFRKWLQDVHSSCSLAVEGMTVTSCQSAIGRPTHQIQCIKSPWPGGAVWVAIRGALWVAAGVCTPKAHPTTLRLYTSVTTARYRNPSQVGT